MKPVLLSILLCVSPNDPKPLNLWPDTAGINNPKKKETAEERDDKVLRISNVGIPTLHPFLASGDGRKTPAVVVCPGGGYSILAYNKEGTEIAEWLNRIGISAFVLKYRVPRNRGGAFQDIQRALRLVRAGAKSWKIDPQKIGTMGFSAGGHLAARLSTNHAKAAYKPVDDADATSCRPDFTVLVYPAYLSAKGVIAKELPVTKKMSPTLIVHAKDDRRFIQGSLDYEKALKQAGAPVRLLLFDKGGHGHGLRCKEEPMSAWPRDCEAWFREIGVLDR